MSSRQSPKSFSSEQSSHSTSESVSGEHLSLSSVLVIDDVRVTPGHMHFANAYEGKTFEQKLVIQNCGRQSALVRLCEPSAKTFQVKAFPQGLRLSPGMRITRTVRYTYRVAVAVLKGFTTVWINKRELTYHFFVSLTEAILSLEPQVIDFGKINAVNRASSKTFFVKNDGYQGSRFSIDLGRNVLGLSVQPLKAVVPAKSSVLVTVEIIGSKAGEFMEEIWIKADPPLRLVIMAKFIEPKIIVRKFISSMEFTHLEFPRTYYGAASTLPLLFRNFSSSNSMFCVMAEVKGVPMSLEKAREVDENYCNFTLKPTEGRMASLKGTIIEITFQPVKGLKRRRPYAACHLKVVRLDCTDVDFDIYNKSSPTNDTGSEKYPSPNTTSSIEEVPLEGASNVNLELVVPDPEEPRDENQFNFVHAIGVCIYGEKEMAGVSLRPNLIQLGELTLDRQYQRELLITNKSQFLPVRVKYRKVASIDVKPSEFDLGPEGNLEVWLTIRTFKLDTVATKITFDLFWKDGDMNITRKVGTAHLKVQTGTTDMVKKSSRFCQHVLCDDIAERLEAENPYRLTETEMAKKKQNDDYYLSYIRSFQKSVVEGDLDLEPKLLSLSMEQCATYSHRSKKAISPFIPLAPGCLYNIKITPRSLQLQKVAAYTMTSAYFTIENLNSFPIRVFMKASKPCIVFDQSRYVIRSKEQIKVLFTFSTTKIGKYFTNVDILINDSTLFEATIVAHVVPKTLKIENSTISFTESDEDFKFFKIMNNLNARVTFKWDVPMGCYQIFPLEGVIDAERSMYCRVTHSPDPSQSQTIECTLTSESGQQKIVTIACRKRQPSVIVDRLSIDAGVVPLNSPIRKKIIVQNLRNFQVLYRIDTDALIPGITVEPTEGVLNELANEVFVITILMTAVIEFNVDIKLRIDNEESVRVNLTGVVEYPAIKITPEFLHFSKISPDSFDIVPFSVQNLSNIESHISFPFEEYPEFRVSPLDDDATHHQEMSLHPNQSRLLFLHFHPQHVSTFFLSLPYVINGILGPVLLKVASTMRPAHYLETSTEMYMKLSRVRVLPVPRALPNIEIYSCTTNRSLTFTNLDMKFVFFEDGHYCNSTYAEFEMSNASTETIAVCIRTDDLLPHFTLVPQTESNVEVYDVSYKIILNEKQKITFEANFAPMVYGTYSVKLPIFLQGYCNNRIFNYITMSGTYDVPKIVPSCERCDFEPIPIDLTGNIGLSLLLQNHFDDCFVSAKGELSVTFDGKREEISKEESLLYVTLNYVPTKMGRLDSMVEFHCTCRGYGCIQVTGVAENCLLTTHALSHAFQLNYLPATTSNSLNISDYNRSGYSLNRSRTCFPSFPEDDDDTQYGEYMRQVQTTLERWIFSQGYYMTVYRRIPEGFANFFKPDFSKEEATLGKSPERTFVGVPLVQLMINFCGPQIKDQLSIHYPRSRDPLEWLTFTYKANCNILNYLRSRSAYMPHVKTKYLLAYDQYAYYEKLKHHETEPMEEKVFQRISKQCWIDLLLQIIKIFFLFAIVALPESEEDRCQLQLKSTERSQPESTRHVLDKGFYGVREKVLIAWLQDCYDNERETLWSSVPAQKTIVFLDEDLQDGLVLGAVTAHYCPYMRPKIRDMYAVPRNDEELHHNACLLIKIWRRMNFSFVIGPSAFQEVNMIEMLLLVTYLYNVLPNCTPREEIMIHAPLTQENSADIELHNVGDDPIRYEMVLLGNKSDSFYGKSSIIIPPRKKRNVKIHFRAKSVTAVNATVLFSGETVGYKYARNIALTLLGVPDVSYVCQEIPIEVELLRPCLVTLNLQSSFKIRATYSLCVGFMNSQGKRVSYSWSKLSSVRTVKELAFPDGTYEFDEKGQSTVTTMICCEQIGPRDVWLSFTNPEIGDFGIKLTVRGIVTKRCYEPVQVSLPKNYDQLTCTCKNKDNPSNRCPKILQMKLPMKNNALWNARKHMILKCASDAEHDFWTKHIFTPLGTRIIVLLLDSETHPSSEHIEETVEYRIEVKDNQKSVFSTFGRVVVEDVTCEASFNFPIHPLRDLNEKEPGTLILVSADQRERRFYKLHFKNETKIGENLVDVA